jgi:hypothetical protein
MKTKFFAPAARSLAAVCLLAIPSVPLLADPAKAAGARHGIPRLGPGEVWVSSVPVGLEVRAGEDPNAKKVLGRTPLVVNARDVGRFVTVRVEKKEYGGELPSQVDLADLTAKTTHSTVIQRGPEGTGPASVDFARGLTFEIGPERKTVIALFQGRSQSLDSIRRLYPRGTNFQFRDDEARKTLAGKAVPEAFIGLGIELLHRGGKVALPGGNGWLVAEATASKKIVVVDAASVSKSRK